MMLFAIVLLCLTQAASLSPSVWVTDTGTGLNYKTFGSGNMIMDFSSVGYKNSDVPIPFVATKATVTPSGGDDGTRIQDAIDAVSKFSLQSDGFRGSVQLAAGVYHVGKPLYLRTSGVVVKGTLDGKGSLLTSINLTGKPFTLFVVGQSCSYASHGASVKITDTYIPSGSHTLRVSNSSGLSVGDTVLVQRDVTDAYIHFMGMDHLVRDGKPETWIRAGTSIATERTVAAVKGTSITFTVPLSDSIDAKYLDNGRVTKCSVSGRLSNVGLESFYATAPGSTFNMSVPQSTFFIVQFECVIDAWVRDIATTGLYNFAEVKGYSKRITMEGISMSKAQVKNADSPKSSVINVDHSDQILVDRFQVLGLDDLFFLTTGSEGSGPLVIRNSHFDGIGSSIQPHMRWSTGLLVETTNVTQGDDKASSGIDIIDRGTMGSGHGWTMGWAVVWNCNAPLFTVQQPPGGTNWCIGCVGHMVPQPEPGGDPSKDMPQGIVDSPNAFVVPTSLFQTQLKYRLQNATRVDL